MSAILEMANENTRELWDTLHTGYTHPHGHPLLRSEIASQYESISEENVLVTTGTQEALQIGFQGIIKPGDHVIAPVGFEPHYHIPEALGASVDLWRPTVHEDGTWNFLVTDLESMFRDDTKLIVLCFPHNPTGCLLAKEDLQKICTLADERDVIILSDEIFRGVERDPEKRLPSVADISETAVVCNGLSKVYGSAGLRIGWAVTRDKILQQKIIMHHYYSTICASAPSEVLTMIVLQNSDDIVSAHQQTIKQNLLLLSDFFGKHSEEFSWTEPDGGTIGLAEVKNMTAEKFSIDVLTSGIMAIPSSVLDLGNNHIRIGYGRRKLPQVLDILEKHLSSQ